MSKLIYSLSPSYNLQSEFKCNFYNICHLDSFILNFHFFFNSNLNLTRTKIIANIIQNWTISCVCFVDRCFSYFFWPLCCLSFFELLILSNNFNNLTFLYYHYHWTRKTNMEKVEIEQRGTIYNIIFVSPVQKVIY